MSAINDLRKAWPGDGWEEQIVRGSIRYTGVVCGVNIALSEYGVEVPTRDCVVHFWQAIVYPVPVVGTATTPQLAAQMAHEVLGTWAGYGCLNGEGEE